MERLESAVVELCDLADRLTLVGGCLTPLLITDPAAPPPRPTIDVDLIVEVTTTTAYDRLSLDMRQRGFQPGADPDDPICRFRKGGIIIDLMPTSPQVLGFGNRWYPLAAATAAAETISPARISRTSSLSWMAGPNWSQN
jgi:hypothetical protein